MKTDPPILIAGGGPVGLFCALLLGERGVPVRLFEACGSLNEDPRAATTHPATLELLGEGKVARSGRRTGNESCLHPIDKQDDS